MKGIKKTFKVTDKSGRSIKPYSSKNIVKYSIY